MSMLTESHDEKIQTKSCDKKALTKNNIQYQRKVTMKRHTVNIFTGNCNIGKLQ